MTDIVIYHKGCSDGLLSAAIVLAQNPGCQAVAMHYGDDLPPMDTFADKGVTIVDFSLPPEQLNVVADAARGVLVIDHHVTAVRKLDGFYHPYVSTVFDMARSGAGLTWDTLVGTQRPLAVEWVEDRDLWKWRHEETRAFGVGARLWCGHDDPAAWAELLDNDVARRVYEHGLPVCAYIDQQVAAGAERAKVCSLNGIRATVVNCDRHITSEVGNVLAERFKMPALMYTIDGDRVYASFRSVGDLDVSLLAQKFGGGGHKNAAGFTMRVDEFFAGLAVD